MEEEIDLRPYIEALLRGWKWIVGTAVVAGVVALVVSLFIPPSYEATALVAVVGSQNIVQFDPRIRETDSPQPLKAFPQLALSDQILLTVLGEVTLADVDNVEQLRQKLEAKAGSDVTLLELTVKVQDAAEAAAIANIWATIFVDWANEVYGDTSPDQVQFFEGQLVAAESELARAEAALVAYQAVNQQLLVTNSLNALSRTQAKLLDSKQVLARLAQDTAVLREQLGVSVGNVSVAEQLTALVFEMKAFGLVVDGGTAVPIQLQLDSNAPLTYETQADQELFLDGLLAAIGSQMAHMDAELEELEPQILQLQEQKQEAETEYGRLSREQQVAEETYTALAHKVEEERITSADISDGVRLASEAVVPIKPVSQLYIWVIMVGGVGMMFSMMLIVGRVWWVAFNKNQVLG